MEYGALLARASISSLTISLFTDPSCVTDFESYDIAFGEPSLLRSVLPKLTSVQWVQSTWAGVEPLLDRALRRDYILTNARGIFGPQMCEYVFSYALAHERRLLDKFAAQQAGLWDATPPGTLRGKTIGLLGVGTIGSDIAKMAHSFGMYVRGYTFSKRECEFVDDWFHASATRRARRFIRLPAGLII